MDAYTELMESFEEETRGALEALFEECHLSFSERLEAAKNEADLLLFGLDGLEKAITLTEDGGRRRHDELVRKMREHMHAIRYSETDYSDFTPPVIRRPKCTEEITDSSDITLTGRCPCPVDGEKTRCCKLVTLDAVTGCSFGCAYCSVQSFYSTGRINILKDFEEKFEGELTDKVWHIGTGQASDSLLLGDTHGTLSSLASFAERHNRIIIELKSKCARTDFLYRRYPANMVFTWSLNAPTIAEKEEHLTASPEERIRAARATADNGSLVGFHIHPMVYFKGWREEYSHLVSLITENFTPDEICMISLGTLTFTKSVLRLMRTRRHPSRVLSMPLVESAGKYTYTNEIKREMFSHVYSCFPEEYRRNIFFYLCMEDPQLWPEVLHRSYDNDAAFEADMKRCYMEKVGGHALKSKA